MRPAAALPLKKACPLEGDLPGTGAVRHCASCATDVVDLSLLTAAEADRMLANPARPKCVSYRVDEEGNVIHLAPSPAPARRRLPVLAAGLLLAACNGSSIDGTAPAPTPVTSSLAAAASPSASSSATAPAAPPAAPEPTEKHTRGELAAPTPAASGDNPAGCNPDESATAANDKQGNPMQPNVPGPKKPKKPKAPMMRGYM